MPKKYLSESTYINLDDVFRYNFASANADDLIGKYDPDTAKLFFENVGSKENPGFYRTTVSPIEPEYAPNGLMPNGYMEKYKQDSMTSLKDYNRRVRNTVNKLIDDTPDELKDFKPLLEVISELGDESWNVGKYLTTSPNIAGMLNYLSGAPKITAYTPEELKEGLGEAYEPLVHSYEAIRDIVRLDKAKITADQWTDEDEKKYTADMESAMKKFVDNFDKLYKIPVEKQQSDKYINNNIGHITGLDKSGNGARSTLFTAEGMRTGLKALEHGYKMDEIQPFNLMGKISAGFKQAKFELQNKIDKLENEHKNAVDKKLAPLNDEELKTYRNILKNKKNNRFITKDDREFFNKNKERYLLNSYGAQRKKLAEEAEKLNAKETEYNNMVNGFLAKEPKTLEDKLNVYHQFEEYCLKNKDFGITSGSTIGSMYEKESELVNRTIVKMIDTEAEKCYEGPNPDENRLLRLRIENTVRYNNPESFYGNRTALREASEQLASNIQIPRLSDYYMPATKRSIDEICETLPGHLDYDRTIKTSNDSIKTVFEKNYTGTALEEVRTGISIGFFGKQEYKDVLAGLQEIYAIRNDDRKDPVRNRDDIPNRPDIYNEGFIKKEEKILGIMDSYIARKEKELAQKYNKNSTLRMNKMKKAREAFRQQVELDKKVMASEIEFVEKDLYTAEKDYQEDAKWMQDKAKGIVTERMMNQYVNADIINDDFYKLDALIKKEDELRNEKMENLAFSISAMKSVKHNDDKHLMKNESLSKYILKYDDQANLDKARNMINKTGEEIYDSVVTSMYIQLLKDKFALKIDEKNPMNKELNEAMKPENIKKGVGELKEMISPDLKKFVMNKVVDAVDKRQYLNQDAVMEIRDEGLREAFGNYKTALNTGLKLKDQTRVKSALVGIEKTERLSVALESPVTQKSMRIKVPALNEQNKKVITDEANKKNFKFSFGV